MTFAKNSHISDLLIKDEHERSKHMRTQTVIFNLRQRFWIIGLSSKYFFVNFLLIVLLSSSTR